MRRFEEKLPMNLISMQRLGLLTIRNRSAEAAGSPVSVTVDDDDQ
jgi:hypothetical protein